MLIDIHLHTLVSKCSALPLADILTHARARGLDGVCITDHGSRDAAAMVREGFQPDGLLVLVGMEYSTPQGDFLVFGPRDAFEPGLTFDQLAVVTDESGGVVVSAHPCRAAKPADLSVCRAGGCRIVEVVNGGNTEFENAQAMAFAKRRGLIGVSGSDAHCLKDLGILPTRFTVPISCMDDLVAALKQGQCRPSVMHRQVA